MTNSQLTFGEWLDDHLRQRKWSQTAFADAVGVARPTVNSWINNVQPPRRRVLPVIAKVLAVDVNEVLVRAGQPPQDPGYRLPEDRMPDDEPQTEIDITDPLLAISAAYADKLTDEQKRLLGELIKDMARRGELDGV